MRWHKTSKVLVLAGLLLLLAGVVVAGVGQRVMVRGVPTSLGSLTRGNVSDIEYSVTYLTPFSMKIITQQQGCSNKPREFRQVRPYGQTDLLTTIETDRLAPGSQKVRVTTAGYCGKFPFVIEHEIGVEVIKR